MSLSDFKNAKLAMREGEGRMSDMLMKGTAPLREELAKVQKKLNSTVEQIVSSAEFQKIQSDTDKHAEKVYSYLEQAMKHYDKKKRAILAGGSKDKERLISELYHKMESTLFTPEEISAFRKHAGRHILMITAEGGIPPNICTHKR